MAILEKEVLVGLANVNIKYFESLGYEIPRYKDRQGRMSVKNGTKILVKVEDLQKRSGVKLTKICDMEGCGKLIPNQQYCHILERRDKGDGKDRCQKCSSIQGGITQRKNLSYNNSLEFWAKENSMEHILLEFSDKNKKSPSEVSFGTNDKYLWKCKKCTGEYSMSISKRTTRKSNCPYCVGKKVLIGYNDLFTTHPIIAGNLVNRQRGYELTSGSHKKENFKCNDCGYIMQNKTIGGVIQRGLTCPKCGDGISYPEKLMLNILNQTEINFESQKVFRWSKNKRYDFYIEKQETIIEIHGEQHYKYSGFTRTLKEEQENDRLKEKLAKENGIKTYITIDARRSELNYIIKSILGSNLPNILNLSNIDWDKSDEFAISNLVKTACDMWVGGVKNTAQIGEFLKIHPATIIKYLKLGAKLAWCDYTAQLGGHNKISIVQLTMDGDYIKEWKSGRQASRELNVNFSSITAACKGKYNHAGGFRWLYKSDYQKIN